MDIAFERVSLRYGETVVLEEVSFRVQSGQFALIEGPSGAGKSSMLRLINRLEDPSSGTISADGRPLPEWPVLQLRRQIAYVPQIPVLFPGTVRENLLTPFRFRANRDRTPPTDEELRARLSELLLEVKLEETATTLSVGQQQRIALLRAALLEPRLMLCDEPTAPLDPDSREVVERTLERWNQEQGITVFLVTHQGYRPKASRPRRFLLGRDHRLREVEA
ncbi:MAG: ABC transporter ATP-binding protein [Candidatus Poribacteria bacterium]|nr:MAG: ABC transporter ATP-binding protein [Candidatus Poribacteria bacterium]